MPFALIADVLFLNGFFSIIIFKIFKSIYNMEIVNEKILKKCPYCNTKFYFTYSDIQTKFILNTPYISCPACNNDIYQLDSE